MTRSEWRAIQEQKGQKSETLASLGDGSMLIFCVCFFLDSVESIPLVMLDGSFIFKWNKTASYREDTGLRNLNPWGLSVWLSDYCPRFAYGVVTSGLL